METFPTLIPGGDFIDSRGQIKYCNDFKFDGVNRFYVIRHPDCSVIRGWQGHRYESKYYFPIEGKWIIGWVKMEVDKP